MIEKKITKRDLNRLKKFFDKNKDLHGTTFVMEIYLFTDSLDAKLQYDSGTQDDDYFISININNNFETFDNQIKKVKDFLYDNYKIKLMFEGQIAFLNTSTDIADFRGVEAKYCEDSLEDIIRREKEDEYEIKILTESLKARMNGVLKSNHKEIEIIQKIANKLGLGNLD